VAYTNPKQIASTAGILTLSTGGSQALNFPGYLKLGSGSVFFGHECLFSEIGLGVSQAGIAQNPGLVGLRLMVYLVKARSR
jgi:hypothetical protein